MGENKNKEISIYCDTGVGFYAIKPFVEELQLNNVKIFFYTIEKSVDLVSSYFSINKKDIINYQKSIPKWKMVLDKFIKKILVKNTFSSQYDRINSDNLLTKIVQALPKPKKQKINRIYNSIWKRLNTKQYFKTQKVVYVTRSANTILLNNSNHKFDVIVESWDHPAKAPFFMIPEKVFVWNSELEKDTKEIQNFTSCEFYHVFPLKFRYLKEDDVSVSSDRLIDDLEFIKKHSLDYILYICTYSSFSKNGFFEGEKQLINDLVNSSEKNNKKLFIKPHPHYDKTDFDYLESNNVYIGTGALNNGHNYVFSDQEQYYKKQLIKNAERIINVGTTFLLESSYFNEKIIQLSLADGVYGNFHLASNNYHLKNYLNKHNDVFHVDNGNKNQLIESIVNDDINGEYAAFLKNWIFENSKFNNNSILNTMIG